MKFFKLVVFIFALGIIIFTFLFESGLLLR